jgi:hypothetical protein
VNARVPAPGGGEPALAAAAAELLAAGEALVRASNALGAAATGDVRPRLRTTTGRSGASMPPEDRLSGKQLGAIRAAARRAGLSRDGLVDLLERIAGKDEPAALSRPEASLVLDKLSAMTGYAR